MGGGVIAVLIVLAIGGGITASIVACCTLPRHRADAVAMAGRRRRAEKARANQELMNAAA